MNNNNKTFISSDYHFFHKNIIKFCQRPFDNVDEMNRVLINNWNNIVSKEDTVYFLGDFSLGNYAETKSVLDQLNGNIIFIKGNHDNIIERNHILLKRFESFVDYKEINVDNKHIVLFHYPIESWNRQFHGSIHIHGHTHGNFAPTDGLILDAGLDGVLCKSNDPKTYRPLEIHEILDYMKTRKQVNKNEV